MFGSLVLIDEFESSESIPLDAKNDLCSIWRSSMTSAWPSVYAHLDSYLPTLAGVLFEDFSPPVLRVYRREQRSSPELPQAVTNKHALRARESLTFRMYMAGRTFNLVGALYSKAYQQDSVLSEYLRPIPAQLREYYCASEGLEFAQSVDSVFGSWGDLPKPRRSFDDIADIRRDNDLTGREHNFLAVEPLEGVISTSSGSFVFLNMETSKFLYFNKHNDTVLHEVKNVVAFWDNYCAFVLKHGTSSGFDFDLYL